MRVNKYITFDVTVLEDIFTGQEVAAEWALFSKYVGFGKANIKLKDGLIN